MDSLSLNEKLLDAVGRYNLPLVKQLLQEGADVLYVSPRDDGDGLIQPDTVLGMVMFKLADNQLNEEDFQTFSDITQLLLEHGAHTDHAMALAEQSYGPFDAQWLDASQVVLPMCLIARAHVDRLKRMGLNPGDSVCTPERVEDDPSARPTRSAAS